MVAGRCSGYLGPGEQVLPDIDCHLCGAHRIFEHAGDVRRPAWNAVCRCDRIQVEAQMTAEFMQYLFAGAFVHRLGDEIAYPVRK